MKTKVYPFEEIKGGSLVWLERNWKVKRNEKLRINGTESQKSFQSCRLPATVSIYIVISKFQIFSFLFYFILFPLNGIKRRPKSFITDFCSVREEVILCTCEFGLSFVFRFLRLFLKSFGFFKIFFKKTLFIYIK